MVGGSGGIILVINNAICFKDAFARLLEVTLCHINILMHVIAHRTARRRSLSCWAFIAIFSPVRSPFDVLLVRLRTIIECVLVSIGRATILGRQHGTRLTSHQPKIFRLVDGTDYGLMLGRWRIVFESTANRSCCRALLLRLVMGVNTWAIVHEHIVGIGTSFLAWLIAVIHELAGGWRLSCGICRIYLDIFHLYVILLLYQELLATIHIIHTRWTSVQSRRVLSTTIELILYDWRTLSLMQLVVGDKEEFLFRCGFFLRTTRLICRLGTSGARWVHGRRTIAVYL